ncbi:MAG: nickel-dependent hydrogenase large subunit [Candidatus Omnitrophica bacterium]|nr:nickel-dependent hydrogenase large subunit [Candidatus Omnitrophota bacterium]
MAKKIIIDPISRIEGHLGIEVEVEKGKVVDAKALATLFRGFEIILKGRDPRDALHLTQRICGVCSASHARAAVENLDSAFGVTPPDNARIIRNLVQGANYLHSHILHFYHLAALDYVIGPEAPPFIPRVKGDYRLPKEINDKCVSHYLEALKIRMLCHEMRALFAGKAPHHVGFVPGGVTCQPTVDRIAGYLWRLRKVKDFIDSVYLPDVLAIADVYKDYKKIGSGYKNLLSYGVFDLDASGKNKLLKRARYTNGRLLEVDPAKITEEVKYSWYNDETSGKNPAFGETLPQPDKLEGYSWAKAPRYDGLPHEVGALARMWVNGDYREGISVIDRHVARALEAQKIADALEGWLLQLKPGSPIYNDCDVPESAIGMGLTEAPRGALGHWIRIKDRKIENYQCVVPTTWNVSPRDDKGVRGPVEEALVGVPVKDPDNPIEVLRVVRSFDPCIACTVHLIKPNGEMKKFHVM